MSNSESSWLKKFVGENPNAKALRERLDETSALLAEREKTIAEQQSQLAEVTERLERETAKLRYHEVRINELTSMVSEAESARDMAEELLKQAQAQTEQAAAALDAERKSSATALAQTKVKAESSARLLNAQIQKLEKQTIEQRTEHERTTAELDALKAMTQELRSDFARSEHQRRTALSELALSRSQSSSAEAATANLEAALASLRARLEVNDTDLLSSRQELARCRRGASAILCLAAATTHAVFGRALPIALRIAEDTGELKASSFATSHDDERRSMAHVKQWLESVGISALFETGSAHQIGLAVRKSDFADEASDVSLGYWLGGVTAWALSKATKRHYAVTDVRGDSLHLNVILKPLENGEPAGRGL